jgi:spectinomycin phosphotransferase
MLEKPNLEDAKIVAWILDHYGLAVLEMAFLPTGYQNTAAYRVVAVDGTPYFLKLRRDALDQTSLSVLQFLSAQGLRQMITPISTRSGQLWAYLDDYNVILYPFVEGHNAFAGALTDRQWFDFGTAFKKIHSTELPPALTLQLQRETYSPHWRAMMANLQDRAGQGHFADPVAAEVAAFVRDHEAEIRYLVRRCEQLSSALQAHPPEFVLCHSDIHAGNLLIDAGGRLYVVDWDNPLLAPKERDLMFIGGGVGGIWNTASEEGLFYAGYGRAEINPVALAYYRFERILEDLAPQVEQVLLTNLGGYNRARILPGIQKWFSPQDVVAMAHKADRILPE